MNIHEQSRSNLKANNLSFSTIDQESFRDKEDVSNKVGIYGDTIYTNKVLSRNV